MPDSVARHTGAMPQHALFVSTARRLEGLVAAEVAELGGERIREAPGGVSCVADTDAIHRMLLFSRIGSRVLLLLGDCPAPDADTLQAEVAALPWERHLRPGASLAVDFHGQSAGIRHTYYGAQRVKDGVVERLTRQGRPRPAVDPERPDARISARLQADTLSLALDLSGSSLHRRGYRGPGGEAPLRETLAAAVLRRAGWPDIARAGGTLFDPCCGSGTLLIEGALMAGGMPLRLDRDHWGLQGWRDHDPAAWDRALADARTRWQAARRTLPAVVGLDTAPEAVEMARRHIASAGLEGHIEVRVGSIEDAAVDWPPSSPPGLLVANPPYGERLQASDTVERLHMALGDRARRDLPGWRLAVLTADGALLAALGLRARRTWSLYNGALNCRLGVYEIGAGRRPAAPGQTPEPTVEPPEELVNRLRKNERHLARWRRREAVGAWRLYDADLPEYAFAVDVYDTVEDGRHASVQEYAPPARIAPRKAEARRRAALAGIAEALEVTPGKLHLRVRRRRRVDRQYQRQGSEGQRFTLQEGPARLAVNLTDYLDTGLFLDHRPLRARLRAESAGRHFLNLFCYTGSATVHAALGGASRTTSVDLSRRYLDWLRANLALNDLAEGPHEIIRADCLRWLATAADQARRYDLILLDPPSVSRSSAMRGDLDVQRDHVTLIRTAAALLGVGGSLYFSTNLRRFRLDADALSDLAIEDVSRAMLPPDFARGPDIHHCWRIGPK